MKCLPLIGLESKAQVHLKKCLSKFGSDIGEASTLDSFKRKKSVNPIALTRLRSLAFFWQKNLPLNYKTLLNANKFQIMVVSKEKKQIYQLVYLIFSFTYFPKISEWLRKKKKETPKEWNAWVWPKYSHTQTNMCHEIDLKHWPCSPPITVTWSKMHHWLLVFGLCNIFPLVLSHSS